MEAEYRGRVIRLPYLWKISPYYRHMRYEKPRNRYIPGMAYHFRDIISSLFFVAALLKPLDVNSTHAQAGFDADSRIVRKE